MFWSFERKHNILDEHVIKLFYTIQVQNVHNKKCVFTYVSLVGGSRLRFLRKYSIIMAKSYLL